LTAVAIEMDSRLYSIDVTLRDAQAPAPIRFAFNANPPLQERDMASFARRMKTALETLSTVLVIVAAGTLLWTVFAKEDVPPTLSAGAKQAPVSDVKDSIAKERLTNVLGTGQLAIVEFTDYECPFCAKHATETFPALKPLIDDGTIRYVSLDLPLQMHANAVPAAEAAECAAEQGKFWEAHAWLFANQKNLASALAKDAAPAIEGLSLPEYAACLAADVALARVRADEAEAQRLGVASTPNLFIGRMRADGGVDLVRLVRGALPASVFIDEISKLKG
jgi:protein-disulfide isomerase